MLFYAPVIFTALGASQQAALLSAVAVRPAGSQWHSSRLGSDVMACYRCLSMDHLMSSSTAKHHRQVHQEESNANRDLVLSVHRCAPSAGHRQVRRLQSKDV